MEERGVGDKGREDREKSKENGVVFFDDNDIKEGLGVCGKSLVGRILSNKSFSIGTIEPAMFAIWRQLEGFHVTDHGENTFQFFFDNEQDLIRVEKEVP
ncbi:hypothetical protein AHAS_Ahas18G0127600 [Arachis hypogaea]